MLLYFLVINEQFSDQCTELTEWSLQRGGGGRGAENQRPGPRVLLHIFRCNKLKANCESFLLNLPFFSFEILLSTYLLLNVPVVSFFNFRAFTLHDF